MRGTYTLAQVVMQEDQLANIKKGVALIRGTYTLAQVVVRSLQGQHTCIRNLQLARVGMRGCGHGCFKLASSLRPNSNQYRARIRDLD